jgi:hypothetical protein
MILAPTLTLSAGSGAAIVRPTFSRDFAGEKTLNNGTGPAITFTRASNATFFDANGTLQTAANDTPRFDHDPATGASLGLLVEGQRTNLLLNSATLATQTVTVTADAHTLSFYGTGEVVLSGVHSATVTGAGAFPTRTTLTFTPTAGSLTATVSGTVENAQLEVGAFATSYIPTTGATVTRAADSAIVTPISSFYNQAEGTMFAEAERPFAVPSGQFPRLLDVSDGTGDNRITLGYSTAALSSATAAVGGVLQSSLVVNNSNALRRVAGAYKTDDFALSANGSAVATAVSGTMPSVSSLRLANDAPGNRLNGHLRKVAYYPRRLSNTLLQQLTT